MSFATPQERVNLRNDTGLCKYTVQIISSIGVEIEIAADDADHAHAIQVSWLRDMGASQSEISRVLHDGTLNPIMGIITSDDFREYEGAKK